MIPKIHGLIAATFTPMHPDGSLNLAVIPAYADMLIHHQLKGVFVAGSTGEGVSLSYAEKAEVIEAWGQVTDHRLLKIAMVGGNSVQEMKELAQLAQRLRYDAVAVLAPHYFILNKAETLAQICIEVGKAAPNIGLYFYHIPVLTGVSVSMIEFLEHIDGKLPNFWGIKYTHHDMMEFNQCLNFADGKYDILWGWDEVLLGGMAMGARGGVGSTFNYAAPLYHQIMAAFDAGDLPKAKRLQEKSIEIVRLLGKYGGIATGKAYMRAIGLDCGGFRLPVRNMSEAQYEAFVQELETIDFFAYSSSILA
ncbi:MAG: dihydrodipicolinate synthase family protein [Runella sp.]